MAQDFVIHDLTAFPVVLFRPEAATPGYAAVWADEMKALCEGPAFAIVFPRFDIGETYEDIKARGLWLKENHDQLARCCRLLVTIEENEVRRAALHDLLFKRSKAFGVKQACVANLADAVSLAVARLHDDEAPFSK